MDRSIKRTFSFHKRNKRHSRNPYCNRRKRQQQAIPNIQTTIPFSEPAGRDGKGEALQKPGPNRNWGHKSKPQRETRETGISYLTPLRALTAGEVRAGDRKWQKGWWTPRPVMLQENIGNLTLRLSGIGAHQERSGVVLWFSKAWDRGEATEARKAPSLCGFLLENGERRQEGLDKGAAKDEEWNAFTVLIGALATNQIFHCLECVRRNRHLGFL